MSTKIKNRFMKPATRNSNTQLLDRTTKIDVQVHSAQYFTLILADGKVFNMSRDNVSDLVCEYLSIQCQCRWPMLFGSGLFSPGYHVHNPVEYAFLETLFRITPEFKKLLQVDPNLAVIDHDRDMLLCLSMVAFVCGGAKLKSVAASVSTKGIVALRAAMRTIDDTHQVFDDGVAGQHLPPLRGKGFFERQWNRFVDLGLVEALPSSATH